MCFETRSTQADSRQQTVKQTVEKNTSFIDYKGCQGAALKYYICFVVNITSVKIESASHWTKSETAGYKKQSKQIRLS